LNQDLDALTLIRDLSSDEFERFRTALHILTSKTFIIRGIDREQQLYDFTIRNIRLFETWFSCMDATLVWDESLGVIAFRGSGNTRIRFSRDEICAVLVLRLLYEDKKLEVSLTNFSSVTIKDFQDKYNAMTGEEIKKTALINVLRRLSSCKLVSIDSNDYADPEANILLYPSIPLSIDRAALEEAVSLLGKKEEANEELGILEEQVEGEE